MPEEWTDKLKEKGPAQMSLLETALGNQPLEFKISYMEKVYVMLDKDHTGLLMCLSWSLSDYLFKESLMFT